MERFQKLTQRVLSFLDNEDPSGDPDFLLAPGHVEKLVQEGRIPVQVAWIGPPDGDKLPFYQVPPRKLKIVQIARIFR